VEKNGTGGKILRFFLHTSHTNVYLFWHWFRTIGHATSSFTDRSKNRKNNLRDVDLKLRQEPWRMDGYTKLIFQAIEAVEKEGNMKKARRLLEKAIKLDTENPVAHNNLANVFHSTTTLKAR